MENLVEQDEQSIEELNSIEIIEHSTQSKIFQKSIETCHEPCNEIIIETLYFFFKSLFFYCLFTCLSSTCFQ